MQLVTSNQMREIDRESIDRYCIPSLKLMENAGRGVAEILIQYVSPKEGKIIVFAGKGNNGGDAFVAARYLLEKKYSLSLYILAGGLQELSDDARANLKRLNLDPSAIHWVTELSCLKKNLKELKEGSWMIDGILGTGLKGEVTGLVLETLKFIDNLKKPILAIDIPSGLSADSGHPLGFALACQVTVSLGLPKLGEVLYPGSKYVGALRIAEIGLAKEALLNNPSSFFLLTPVDFQEALPKIDETSHKGDFGHVLVLAGSQGMLGAGYLASLAALRSGAGLATYALPQSLFDRFDARYPEIMGKPLPDDGDGEWGSTSFQAALKLQEDKLAIVLGPAMGRNKKTFEALLKTLPDWKLPLVLDAEGINACAENPALLKKRNFPTVLTPHTGEMARLIGWNVERVKKNRIEALQEAVKRTGCWVVLKGYRTLIGNPEGEIFVNPTGNPGMATAGSGDVLAGILGGWIAQQIPWKEAILASVYLHGLAGDMAAEDIGSRGLVAQDLIAYLPKARRLVEQMKKNGNVI